MSDEKRTPFGQTTAGIILIQGIVTAVVGAVVTSLIGNAAKLPWQQISVVAVIVIVIVFLLYSVIVKRARNLIWGWVPGAANWIVNLRITTKNGRTALDRAAYERRSAEVEAERTKALEPTWRIDARDKLGSGQDFYWLENYGYEVYDVSLVSDPAYFRTEGDVNWDGSFGNDSPGSYIGQWFKGLPTAAGNAEGVTFDVKWSDRNGDKHERSVFMAPEEIRAGRDAVADEAWARGRADGRKELLEEQDKLRSELLKRPRWSVTRDGGGFRLMNAAEGTMALAVTLDVEDHRKFVFTSSAQWTDMNGQASETFAGRAQAGGAYEGITFEVSWTDQGEERHTDKVFLEGWDSGI